MATPQLRSIPPAVRATASPETTTGKESLRATTTSIGKVEKKALRERARFIRVSGASMAESHPHSIGITREAPNYQRNS